MLYAVQNLNVNEVMQSSMQEHVRLCMINTCTTTNQEMFVVEHVSCYVKLLQQCPDVENRSLAEINLRESHNIRVFPKCFH